MTIDDRKLLELKHKIQEIYYTAKQTIDLFDKIIEESEVKEDEQTTIG